MSVLTLCLPKWPYAEIFEKMGLFRPRSSTIWPGLSLKLSGMSFSSSSSFLIWALPCGTPES